MYKEEQLLNLLIKCIKFSDFCGFHCDICENAVSSEEELFILEKASRVLSPLPPKVDYAGEFGDINEYYCPECDEYLSNTENEVFYCPKCGQRIKWGE